MTRKLRLDGPVCIWAPVMARTWPNEALAVGPSRVSAEPSQTCVLFCLLRFFCLFRLITPLGSSVTTVTFVRKDCDSHPKS